MSATVMGTPYSPSSPPDTSSSATMSPAHPDRPIRPLPKRTLRARLSPEIAGTIEYPPAPTASNNMFYVPYAEAMAQKNGAAIKNALREIDNAMYRPAAETENKDKHGYRFKGNELDSEEEEELSLTHRYEEYAYRPETISQGVASSNGSVDGYDSFENTNNKKKRKIPMSGTPGHHPSFSMSLSQDLANMGLSNGDGIDPRDSSDGGLGHYYGTGSAAISASAPGTGISGAGRGRFGRPGRREISGRGPLTSSMNSSNAWQNGRLMGPRRDYGSMSSLGSKVSDTLSDHRIISQAIAEAAALPAMPSNGQENISLLEQQSLKKPSSANTQFTFTCESDASKSVVWPGDSSVGRSAYSHTASPTNPTSAANQSSMHHSRKDFNTQGTQTSPSMANQQGQSAAGGQAAGQTQRKPRRSAAKRYAMAARERRTQQQYNNYHHPPKEDEIWICGFCEYESIFGRPPEALIRDYEIKDRKERKRLAEKRRLLEKAKMKGRKGKKGNKNNGKGISGSAQQQATQPDCNAAHDQPPTQNHGTQSDEYFGDEYDNESGIPMAAPPEIPTRIPQPVVQQPGQSTRVAHGSGVNRPG